MFIGLGAIVIVVAQIASWRNQLGPLAPGKPANGSFVLPVPIKLLMKCLYCETNEARDVLLCYSCQVDLFPLVSAWAYCGACGLELPADGNSCPQCVSCDVPAEPATRAVHHSAFNVQRVEPDRSFIQLQPSEALVVSPSPAPHQVLPQKPLASPAEVAQARRLQLVIRSIFALLWIVIITLVLWWVRIWVNRPIAPILP